MRSKELRAKRYKLIEDARALIAGDHPTPEQNTQFDAAMTEADELMAQIERIERADDRAATQAEDLRAASRRNGLDPDELRERNALEETTFMTWIRRGQAALNPDQRAVYERRFQAALGEGIDTAGGYAVPTGFFQQLTDAEKDYGGMLDVATLIETAMGNALPMPTDNDTTNSGTVLGENTQVGTQDVSFGSITLNAYVYTSKLVLVSNQLLQDSAFPLDAFLAKRLGIRIARAVNTDCTVGNGASKPNGVITAATLGYTAGNSTSSGETASILYDDLVELEHSVDPAYRRNARFMMSDTALKVIKKLKDGMGRPLWMGGLAIKEPDTINGYPYQVNQDMAVPAASAKSVAFGDFSTYYMRRVVGVQLLRLVERYADFNQVGFLAFQRWDGNLVDAGTHPVKYLQNSAT